MDKLLKRTNDLIFKLIFGNEKNVDILEDFLKAVLRLPDEEYNHLRITNPASTIDKVDDKTIILDVKVYTKSRHVLNVEIQVANTPELRDRITYYASRNLSEQMYRGDDYVLKKSISILITDFLLIKENDVYHNIYHLHDAKTDSTFTELIEINTLEIPKLTSAGEGPLVDWLRFISTNEKEELTMLGERNQAIGKATTVLYELSQDEHTRALYDSREKAKWDEQSRLRGAKDEAVIEVARNGLENGIAIDIIMQMTKLTREVVESLKPTT